MVATGDAKIIGAWLAARDSGDLEATLSFWERYGDEVWGPSLVHLEPPEDGGGCVDKLRGDSSCNLLAFDITKDLPDLDEYATRAVPIDFHDERESVVGCDASLEDLIRAGWSFLQDNLDLVDWARCWVFGEGLDGEANLTCLHRMITGDGYFEGTVDIYIRDGVSPWDEHAAADTWGFLSEMIMYPDAPFWQTRLSNWCRVTDDDTRACMAMSVAATLLHELVHYCGRVIDIGSNKKPCKRSYLTQSVFWWALLQRYSSAGDGGSCCAKLIGRTDIFADGRLFADIASVCDALTC